MTNNILNEMTLDNCRGKCFLSPQTGPSRANFSNPPYFDQFEKLFSDGRTTQNMIGFVGMDSYPVMKGLRNI